MPSGKIHEKVNLAATAAAVVTLPVYAAGLSALGYPLGLLVSVLVTPDLGDLKRTRPERVLRRGLRGLSRPLLWPFDVVQSRVPHRSLVSHSPVGTLLRLAILSPLLLAVGWVTGWSFVAFTAMGLLTGDMIHIALDSAGSLLKKLARRCGRAMRY